MNLCYPVQVQNTKSFYELLGTESSCCQPREHRGQVFFSAHCRCVKSFFGQWTYAGFISYPYALPGYTVYIFIPNHPAPHPTTPSSPQQWSTRHYRSWKTCVLFPTSHYFLSHATYMASRSSHFKVIF